MKVVISCPAFNNLKYTKLFLDSIQCSYPHVLFVIDNGSVDGTSEYLEERGVPHLRHNENRGFSCAYNDALDVAFGDGEDNLLLFCGNDIVFRPDAIDYMVRSLLETDYEMMCGNEILNKEILTENERAIDNFKYKFSFEEPQHTELAVSYGGMNHSCLIRQRSSFEKVGYYDAHFYPAYFEDNDYARRCDIAGVKYGTVDSAIFYHFWSRSIHEGGLRELNSRRFNLNSGYYVQKWGGPVGQEKFPLPFGNGDVKISGREYEERFLRHLGVIV